jgi:hypothetical protein
MATAEAEARATRWLQAWDGQGTHRTGTEGDHAGAAWLAAEAAALGATPTIEDFAFARLDPVLARLDIGADRIEGVPVFDAPSGPAEGIEGRLGQDIAVVELTPRAVYSGEFRRLRAAAAHRGLVVVCQGDEPGLGLLNAEQFREPLGPPAIHVPSEARDLVLGAAERGAPARLFAHSRGSNARAANIVATLPGSDLSRRPLVVMTPRSSWWHSTAERGGGIVCWLESLRAVLARPPGRDVVFTANTGHELGHTGLDDFIARRPGWDRESGADWVHYGANLGAAGSVLSLVSNRDELRALGLAALNRAGQPPDDMPWTSFVPSGETRVIHHADGAFLTLVGTNRWFHLPQDRWPHSLDVPAITRIASAAARITLALAG